MSWRCKWSMLHITQKTQILSTFPVCHISSLPTARITVTEKTHASFFEENHKVTLTPQIVLSTLLNCPSDWIALSFFMWSAKQHNYFHNNQAFDHMVSVVSRLTNKCKTVKEIVRELESVGLIIKAQTFLLLLRIYWRGGMYSLVFEAFEEMSSFGFNPNTFAHNMVMDVLFKIGRVDVGIKMLKEIQLPNFLTFSIALCNLCKLNDLVNVKDVMRIMLRLGYYPNVESFEMVLNCFCKVGRLTEAYQVLALMTALGISVSVKSWSILIDGYCRLHQPTMAGFLLKKMVESGFSPNVVTYTTLFKGFMESQMLSSGFGILKTLESEGCVLDLVFCNVLIDTFSKIGRYDDALDVFVSLSKQKLVPDSYTFSTLLSNICSSRRFDLLPKLIRGLVIEADLVVCNSLLDYYCKAGFPFLAVQLYNDIVDKGFAVDSYSFVGLLRGLCGIGRTDQAVNVYHGIVMNHPALLDNYVHAAIIDGLICSGKYHKAITLFRSMVKKYQLDATSYKVVIHGLLKGGMAAEASALFNQITEEKDFDFLASDKERA